MLRVLIRSTSYSSLYFSNQPIAAFTIIYNCLVEIELHREIYHFTHERQTLNPDSNQHTRYTAVLLLNYWAIEVWCEPVHCSLFFQYHHDTCTMAESLITLTGRTSHFMPELWLGRYPNVLLGSCIGLPGLPLIGRALNGAHCWTWTNIFPIP